MKGLLTVKIKQVPGKSRILKVPKGTTIDEILGKLGTHRDRVIVLREGRPVPESTKLEKSESLDVITIISGG